VTNNFQQADTGTNDPFEKNTKSTIISKGISADALKIVIEV
jgi:hypothetical protein